MFFDVPASTSNTVLRRYRPRKRWFWSWQLSVTLCCLLSTVYFLHHAIHGRHGFEARERLIERASMLEFENASLETVRSTFLRDVALLAPDAPSPDFVEEIARDVLGFSRPADIVVRR